MKYQNLIIVFLFAASVINAQNKPIPLFQMSTPGSNKSHGSSIHSENKHDKTGEEVIWSEDFTGGFPEGWTIVDNSGYDMPWLWTTDTIFGCYSYNYWPPSTPYIDSESPETGYMALPADGYNTVPPFTPAPEGGEIANPLIPLDTYFQLPILDLTEYTNGIILEYHQRLRVLYLQCYVEISNDYDPENPETAHWIEFDSDINRVMGDPALDETFRILIPYSLTSQNPLTIRFHAYGGSHYFWNVDDIKLKIPHQNNMELHETWNFYSWHENHPVENSAHFEGYLQHGGYYYQIPKSQVQPFVSSWTKVQNWGVNVQNNVKVESRFYHTSSPDIEITEIFMSESNIRDFDQEEFDTLKIEGIEFLPNEYGYYTIQNIAIMDSLDDYPEDNKYTTAFIVNDSTYSRTTDSITGTVSTRNWVGGGFDGDILAVLYTIYENTEIEAAKWYFHERNASYADYINNNQFKYKWKLFAYDEDGDSWHHNDWETEPVISSEEYVIEISDTGKWITTPFIKDGNSEFLDPGDYLIAIETITGGDPNENAVAFYMGEDKSIPQPDGIMRLYHQYENGWGWAKGNPSFKMIIAAENWTENDGTNIGVEETNSGIEKAFSLSQNFPNPASTLTEINYIVTEHTNIRFEVFDVTGKLIHVLEEGYKSAGKYQIKFDVSNYESGIYYYSVTTNANKITRKMVVLH